MTKATLNKIKDLTGGLLPVSELGIVVGSMGQGWHQSSS